MQTPSNTPRRRPETRGRASIDVTPRVRDYNFVRDTTPQRWWLNQDPIASAIFDGLSATFPHGERFFMDSLRPYRLTGPDALREQISTFIKQEAMHTREHVAFNRHMASHGRDLHAMDVRSKAVVDTARAEPPLAQLAATAALEHFTAILGHVVLSHPKYLQGADPEMAQLWRWHSLEEIEHKAVAFDALTHALRSTSPVGRWLFRTKVMARMTALFIKPTLQNIVQILREDGVGRWKTYGGLLRYALFAPGLIWQTLPLSLAYYKPGFHPWDLDDRPLLLQADEELKSSHAHDEPVD